MVHLSDLDWNRPGEQVIEEFRKGEVVKAQVLDVDVEKERISLGIKQLAGDPFAEAGDLKKGAIVTCEVTEVKEGGIEVKLIGPISPPSSAVPTSRASAVISGRSGSPGREGGCPHPPVRPSRRKVQVSIKALEIAEEKEAVAQYGSADAGASLGDILGAALRARQDGDKD